jgi:hypothetical protein
MYNPHNEGREEGSVQEYTNCFLMTAVSNKRADISYFLSAVDIQKELSVDIMAYYKIESKGQQVGNNRINRHQNKIWSLYSVP